MNASRQFSIRKANAADAESVLRVQFAAIHETASESYEREILDEWAPPVTPLRIAEFKDRFAQDLDGELMFVAVEIDEAAGENAHIDKGSGERVADIDQGSGESAHIDEACNERVLGFGSIVPKICELRAVYVSPRAARSGVGTKLLAHMEEVARSLSVPRLQMDASLNAEQFYLRNGYTSECRGDHFLQSGRRMDCVYMCKEL